MLLTHRGNTLKELTEHPAWPELRAMAEQGKESYLRRIANRLLRGEAIEQRDLDYDRGYYQGIEDLLASPDKAVKQMRRALERAERHIETEGATE
jgi:hypothetical protein